MLFRCVIIFAESWLALATSPPSSCSSSGVHNADCAAVRASGMLQTKASIGVKLDSASKEDGVEEMRSDDFSGAPYTLPDRWPETASDMVCAMETVDSMRGIKYSMYGAFDFGGQTATTRDLKNCEDTACVPLVKPMSGSPWSRVRGEEECQAIATDRSHPHYAFGEEAGTKICYTFAECDASSRTIKAGFKIYSRPPPATDASAASTISCEGEGVIRTEISEQLKNMPHPTEEPTHHPANGQWRPQATALRGVFHDAHDFNSLMAVNKNTNTWEHVDGGNDGYAGVDGCVYDNALAEFPGGHETFKTLSTNNQGSMLYNQQIERLGQNQDFVRIDKLNFKFVREACFNLCCSSESKLSEGDKRTLCGADDCSLGYYKDKCFVDVMTFGSLLIIENTGGPHIPMTWGRKQGDCRNPFKNVSVPDYLETRRIAQGGASLSSFGKPEDVFAEFANIRMNKSETVALMGAHSYGKLHKYTGGPRTRNKGAGFCTDLQKVTGFFGSDGRVIDQMANATKHFNQWSSPPGTCAKGEVTDQGALSCWTNERGYLEPAGGKSAEVKAQEFQNENGKKMKNIDLDTIMKSYITPTWGHGGFWDTTPDKLDNEYFKMLHDTDPNERKQCCGPTTPYGCGADGTPMQDTSGNEINGCDINWCMRSIGEAWTGSGNPDKDSLFPDYAVLSTKQYVQARLDTGNAPIGVHHLYRLAADWALIDDAEASDVVAKFAQDGAAFNDAFAAAWSKLITLGHPQGALQTCAV